MNRNAGTRVVLVDNVFLDRFKEVVPTFLGPHLGLASLASVGRLQGIEVEILDPKPLLLSGTLRPAAGLYSEIAVRIVASQPDVVGFTSLGCNFVGTVRTAAEVKRLNPTIPIMVGGPHATILAAEILATFSQFDVVVSHEAESTFVAIVNALVEQAEPFVPGVTYRTRLGIRQVPRQTKEEELDALPDPAFDLYDIRGQGLTSLRVEAGRGCPFGCKFCSTATFFGRKYRLRSPRRLRLFLDRVRDEYSISDFSLNHDLFTVNREAVIDYCRELTGSGYSWGCSARIDCVDAELLGEMKKAGCRSIYFGIEVGSDRMQRLSAKRLDLSLLLPIARACVALGIATTYSFITGFPEESLQDQEAALDLMQTLLSLDASTSVQLHLLAPEPGTATHREHHSVMKYDGLFSDFTFPLIDSDDEKLILAHPEIFCTHYYYDTPSLARARHVLATTAVETLSLIGRALFLQVCAQFARGLTGLISEMEAWISLQDVSPNVTQTQLVHFLREALGDGHPLCSVVALVGEVRCEGGSVTEHSGVPPVGSDARERERYVRSRFCRSILSRYDLPAFVAHIGEDPSTAWTGQPGSAARNYALIWDVEKDGVCVYELGSVAAMLLGQANVSMRATGTDPDADGAVPESVSGCVAGCVQGLIDAGLMVRAEC